MSKQQSLARFFSVSAPKKRKIEDGVSVVDGVVGKGDKKDVKEKKEIMEEVKVEQETVKVEQETVKVEQKTENVEIKQQKSKPIPYKKLTDIFEEIEKESSRLKIIATVTAFFTEILNEYPKDLPRVIYLFINRLGPDYEPGLELGLGESLLIKAISDCYGRTPAKTREDYHEIGDLGEVALISRIKQPSMFKPKALDMDTVYDNLYKIATSTGDKSQARKISIIIRMLTACEGNESKYLIRSLEGKLRIGLAEKSILVSIAQAFVNFENNNKKKELYDKAEEILRDSYYQVPNYEIIIELALKHGIMNLLEYCDLKPGIPLKPMLAKPTKSITEILDRFNGEEFTCEYKYDGERAQLHLLSNGQVKVYSRNSEDMSMRYPDIIHSVSNFIKPDGNTTSLILDCEAVAWDKETEKILPFQVLSTRKRKDVDAKDIKVNICLFAFDLLCYNDVPMIKKSLAERRAIMNEKLQVVPGNFQFANIINSSSLDDIQKFLDQSIKDACEGLMIKMLNGRESFYEPSKRSRNWLKLKKDYLEGVGDSLDLVVIGAYIGKGKRTGTYGGFLLASYNDDTEEYETTCKIGTGFSEEDLKTIHEKLKPTVINQPLRSVVYDSSAEPDVWFQPTMLFEILIADLSLSPVYKAGSNVYGKGISLRFPRFLRIRDDKAIDDGTSSSQIVEFYERQANLQ